VVIAIIAILAAMILPALARAKVKAHAVKCISNQKQQYLGYHMYADDNRELFPIHADWATVGGYIRSNVRTAPIIHDRFGETNRPLNAYVQAAETFHCPSDRGDSYWPAESKPSCYAAWGNSYLPMWSVDWFGVKHTTANSTVPLGSPDGIPIKKTEIAQSPHNKIIQGDWPWHGSRDAGDGAVDRTSMDKSIWHNNRGQRGWNMMWGDGHVSVFRFPKDYGPSQMFIPINRLRGWW